MFLANQGLQGIEKTGLFVNCNIKKSPRNFVKPISL